MSILRPGKGSKPTVSKGKRGIRVSSAKKPFFPRSPKPFSKSDLK
jgi:hypothetical protein